MATEGASSMPFIKNLASSDRKVRTQALDTLRAFLSARQTAAAPLAPLDALKLWKGLFYALWMADRPVPQQNLCAELAGLLLDDAVIPPAAAGPWLRGFWATMAREWTGIDVLRMEKFLLLVRRVLAASFSWMKMGSGGGKGGKGKGPGTWNAARVDLVVGLLAEWPFSAGQKEETESVEAEAAGEEDELKARVKTIPVGLRIHVLDIWIDEAEKVGLLEEEDAEARQILKRINALVEALNKATPAPAVRVRSRDALADERLPWNHPVGGGGIEGQGGEEEEEADDNSWDGFND